MRGWRWNLIPLFILGFILAASVLLELWRARKDRKANDTSPLMLATEGIAAEGK
jgi:hypothetical protein